MLPKLKGLKAPKIENAFFPLIKTWTLIEY